MRYRLRTLMVLLAVLPPLLAGAWFASLVASPARVNAKSGPILEHGVTREPIDAARREALECFLTHP